MFLLRQGPVLNKDCFCNINPKAPSVEILHSWWKITNNNKSIYLFWLVELENNNSTQRLRLIFIDNSKKESI